MTIENKPNLINEVVARAVNNAPVSELVRVYADALRAHLESLPEDELLQTLERSGYTDLVASEEPQEEPQE